MEGGDGMVDVMVIEGRESLSELALESIDSAGRHVRKDDRLG